MRPKGGWLAFAGLILTVVTAIWVAGGTARRGAPKAQPQLRGAAYVTRTVVHRQPPARTAFVRWSHGSWCWFGDPRAVHVGGRDGLTFIGWIDWHGRITIGVYDPRRGLRRSHVIGRLPVDDHGSPSMLLEPDQRLTVFWSAHGGPRMNYRTSRQPLDIGTWGRVYHVHSWLRGRRGFTYPNPVLLRGEHDTAYLFWRGADWSQDYATRSAAGHWSPAHRLIAVRGQRPYVKVDSDGTNTIALGFTDGHPRDFATSIYYAAYRHGSLWHADGRRIAALGAGPISPARADLVYNGRASGVSAWVWDVAVESAGHPVILYATFPSPARHEYWYARWSGRRWISHLMTVAGPSISPRTIEREYSGGIALDHADPSVVLLSRKVGGRFEIERWVTGDGGSSWTWRTIARARGSNDVRPLVARGSDGGPGTVFWLDGRYRGYTRYRTSVTFAR